MRAVIQRVDRSSLSVDGELVSDIERGVTVLVSVGKDDTPEDAIWIAQKILNVQIFSEEGRMCRSVMDIRGDVLIVSQFTLHANVKKGKRPSFDHSAPSEQAQTLIEKVINQLKKDYSGKVVKGRFGAHMKIAISLEGPVTIWLDSKI